MSGLLSRIVRVVNDELAMFRKDGQWWTVRKVILTIGAGDDGGEIGFVNEFEELLRKYGKDIVDIEVDMVKKFEMEVGQ